jgi:hypothetical protein
MKIGTSKLSRQISRNELIAETDKRGNGNDPSHGASGKFVCLSGG